MGIELGDTAELEEFLQVRFGKKIKIINPKKDKKKGDKKKRKKGKTLILMNKK